jgi:hypothetical protein
LLLQVLKVLVRAVTEKIADASGESADKLKPKLLKLFGHITANVTNSADIWTLYANLLACDTTDKTTVDRVSALLFFAKLYSNVCKAYNRFR